MTSFKGKIEDNVDIWCVIDTWFTWSLSIPYFVRYPEANSLVKQIQFFEKAVLLSEKDWIETATWKAKTYKTYVWVYFWNEVIKSEIMIYETKMKYLPSRDWILLWMEFLEINKMKLNLDFEEKEFELL